MNFKEYKKIIQEEDEKIARKYPINDEEKATFARITKIAEEFGELSEAVLSYYSLQRKSKEQQNKEELSGEIADVVICVSMLAYELDIDLEECLMKKIEKMKSREY